MAQFDLYQAVFVAGMSAIAGLVAPNFVQVPLLMALIFPQFVESAAFVGMVTSLFLGFAVKFSKGR
jgi:hypothetical protein